MTKAVFAHFEIIGYKEIYYFGIFVSHLVKKLPPFIEYEGSLPAQKYIRVLFTLCHDLTETQITPS
jgi:hypothetical protein